MRPGALRWARASDHYQETIAFYRDAVGLPVIDEFAGSYGEDGTIFGRPGTAVELNGRPRQTLGFKTPSEALAEVLR